MTDIVIGTDKHDRDVTLNFDGLLAGRFLVQGISNSGKSWFLRRLLEQSFGEIQQIVIDLEGEYVTLAETFGHIVVDAEEVDRIGGEALAGALREHRFSAIIDLSEAERDHQALLASAILRGLIDAPEQHWRSALVIVDEAHLLAPLGASAGTPEHLRRETTAALTDLMSRGRKRGLIGCVATQRLAKVAKSVISDIENVAIGRNTLDLDIGRASLMIGLKRSVGEKLLRQLKPGQFVFYGPALSVDRPTPVQVGPVESEHRGTAPKVDRPPVMGADDAKGILDSIPDTEIEPDPEPAQRRRSKNPRTDGWTEDEVRSLREGYELGLPVREIQARLNGPVTRTFGGIKSKALDLGLSKPSTQWTDDEIRKLKEMVGAGMHPADISVKLGRPRGGVNDKMHRLGLHFREPWTKAEKDLLADCHGKGYSLVATAKEIGRPYANVAKIAEKMGLSFKRERQPVRVSYQQLVDIVATRHQVLKKPDRKCIVGACSYDEQELLQLANKIRAEAGEAPVRIA